MPTVEISKSGLYTIFSHVALSKTYVLEYHMRSVRIHQIKTETVLDVVNHWSKTLGHISWVSASPRLLESDDQTMGALFGYWPGVPWIPECYRYAPSMVQSIGARFRSTELVPFFGTSTAGVPQDNASTGMKPYKNCACNSYNCCTRSLALLSNSTSIQALQVTVPNWESCALHGNARSCALPRVDTVRSPSNFGKSISRLSPGFAGKKKSMSQ